MPLGQRSTEGSHSDRVLNPFVPAGSAWNSCIVSCLHAISLCIIGCTKKVWLIGFGCVVWYWFVVCFVSGGIVAGRVGRLGVSDGRRHYVRDGFSVFVRVDGHVERGFRDGFVYG